MAKNFASYEVNCKIQFLKIICAENWRIFIQKYMSHAVFLYMRKLYIHNRPYPIEWNQAIIHLLISKTVEPSSASKSVRRLYLTCEVNDMGTKWDQNGNSL